MHSKAAQGKQAWSACGKTMFLRLISARQFAVSVKLERASHSEEIRDVRLCSRLQPQGAEGSECSAEQGIEDPRTQPGQGPRDTGGKWKHDEVSISLDAAQNRSRDFGWGDHVVPPRQPLQ